MAVPYNVFQQKAQGGTRPPQHLSAFFFCFDFPVPCHPEGFLLPLFIFLHTAPALRRLSRQSKSGFAAAGIHRAADHAVRILYVMFQIVHFIGNMRIAVKHLRKRCAFLKFQIFYFVVIIIHIADPEFCPLHCRSYTGFLFVIGIPMCIYSADIPLPPL